MIGKLQQNKVVCFGGPTAVSSGATSASTLDTKGFGYVRVDVLAPAATATDASAKWTSLVLQHGKTTHPTNHTNIVGAVGTTESTATSSQFVLGEHNDTSVGGVTSFFVNCNKHERYLRVVKEAITAAYTTTANVATLSRAANMPDTASELGASAFVIV